MPSKKTYLLSGHVRKGLYPPPLHNMREQYSPMFAPFIYDCFMFYLCFIFYVFLDKGPPPLTDMSAKNVFCFDGSPNVARGWSQKPCEMVKHCKLLILFPQLSLFPHIFVNWLVYCLNLILTRVLTLNGKFRNNSHDVLTQPPQFPHLPLNLLKGSTQKNNFFATGRTTKRRRKTWEQ